jgi:hypothetical protein
MFVRDRDNFLILLIGIQVLVALCTVFGVYRWTTKKFVKPLKELQKTFKEIASEHK